MFKQWHFILVLITYIIWPLQASTNDGDYLLPVNKNEIKIMSYNVHNLFDAQHDNGKNDHEFLPIDHSRKKDCDKASRNANACRKMDWTDEKVQIKYEQIRKVVEAQGHLPDILVLSEVENAAVVEGLGKYLGYSGFVITNSPDVRGIDCAVLYLEDKVELLEFFEEEIENPVSLTRNISAATFRLNKNLGGGVFGVFANHWPSQGNSVEARLIVANQLRSFVNTITELYADDEFNFVLTGDFNTIERDRPNPIDTIVLDSNWAPKMIDVREYSKQSRNPMIAKMPPASYYYGVDSAWNEFDRFFVDNKLADKQGLDVEPMSFRIHAPEFLSKRNKKGEKIPFRYNHNTTSLEHVGYSDHFAIVMKLRYY